MSPILSREQEADRLMAMHGGGAASLPACLKTMSEQMNVIQTRSQLLLTLATVTFTITGFSGPQIARTSAFARDTVVLGLGLVLLATICILLSSLRVKWVTQVAGSDARETLVAVLAYRDNKTRYYRAQLVLLVAGLAAYVSSVVAYLLSLI